MTPRTWTTVEDYLRDGAPAKVRMCVGSLCFYNLSGTDIIRREDEMRDMELDLSQLIITEESA